MRYLSKPLYYSMVEIAPGSRQLTHIGEKMQTHHGRWVGLPLPFPPNFTLDGFTDGQLASALANLCQVSSREAVSHLSQELQIHILKEAIELP